MTTPEWLCDSCGSSFVSTEQVKRWQRLCPCGDGKLHRHAVRRMHVVDSQVADQIYGVVCKLLAQLRESRAKERSTMRQLQAVRKSVASLAARALASDNPEVFELALRQLRAQANFVRVTEMTEDAAE